MAYEIHPVILCGGSGTRLWPLSTDETPKQFLALTSDKSMIEETALRFASTRVATLNFSETLVVGSARHAKLLDEILPTARKVLEPFGRNSAPAVAAACLAHDPKDLVLILPADHDIRDVNAFHQAIEVAAAAANDGAIVTFGIEPTHPATGYGYIKVVSGNSGALDVDAFVEKPDLATAESYLDAGSYYWNAGIFLFRVDAMLEALTQFAPDVLNWVKQAMNGSSRGNVIPLDQDAFKQTPSISIDYAVMEKASNVKTVPVSMGWSDVGGYRALHELLTEDAKDNYASGPVTIKNGEGLYVRSEGPNIAVNGVSNLTIVATEHEVMITPTQDDLAVKTLRSVIGTDRYAQGLSTGLRNRAQNWLWTMLESWAAVCWDAKRGGFVEQLKMNGEPDVDAVRRVRVQARQVYSFSKAISLGWSKANIASELVQKGVTFIDTRLRHGEEGFVHRVDPDGNVVDDRRDLYDHAFIILAGAAAYKATQNLTALKLAEDAMVYINTHLKDDEHGGWFESSEFEYPRRANPHMHLLEAMMEYHDATGSEQALKHAAEIVRLFETKLFNPATDVLGEFFLPDWAPQAPAQETVFEPGHHYEWASLLSFFEQKTGHDTGSWRRRLIRRADRGGLNQKTGFAFNRLCTDGTQINDNSRLWHQLERFRALLLHPSVTTGAKPEQFLESVFEAYLDAGPANGWVDENDASGAPASQAVPASMLYHLVSTLDLFLPRFPS